MNQAKIMDHPLVSHHLSQLRDRDTPPQAFRAALGRLTYLLAFEATSDLRLQDHQIITPVAPAKGRVLSQRIGVVPILRAALGMVDPVLTLLPEAQVWHLGYYRDEKTLEPVEYYRKIPMDDPVDVALVLDPMLATGGSAAAALRCARHWGVKHIKLLSVIAAPEGVSHIQRQFPDVQVYVCAVDEKLNERGYIVPGLGDAGDRMFNTRG
ncbi:MAG: uracil phosphoribosyltransferase [Phycisphaerales bacterium]